MGLILAIVLTALFLTLTISKNMNDQVFAERIS